MAKVQKKSVMSLIVYVKNQDGSVKGSFELTSGSLYYYRKKARNVTAQYSWKKLIRLIEDDIQP